VTERCKAVLRGLVDVVNAYDLDRVAAPSPRASSGTGPVLPDDIGPGHVGHTRLPYSGPADASDGHGDGEG
jgi:hypothetical protein